MSISTVSLLSGLAISVAGIAGALADRTSIVVPEPAPPPRVVAEAQPEHDARLDAVVRYLSPGSVGDEWRTPLSLEVEGECAQAFAWSSFHRSLMRIETGADAVRFFDPARGSALEASWSTGPESYPRNVRALEQPGGDLLVTALVARGSQSELAVGLLRWQTGSDGRPRLEPIGAGLLEAFDVEDENGATSSVGPAALRTVEIAGWDAAHQQATLVYEIAGLEGIRESIVRVERQALGASATRATAVARRIAAGRNPRVLAGESGPLLLVRDTRSDLARPAPVRVLTRVEGEWRPLASSGDPQVGATYAAWLDAEQRVCVATVESPRGAAEQHLRAHRLGAIERGAASWQPLGEARSSSFTVGSAFRLAVDPTAASVVRIVLTSAEGASTQVDLGR